MADHPAEKSCSDLLRFAQTKNTFWWEKAGKGGEKREIVGKLLVCYCWEGSPPDPIFGRYTRYAATTRVNIDDF